MRFCQFRTMQYGDSHFFCRKKMRIKKGKYESVISLVSAELKKYKYKKKIKDIFEELANSPAPRFYVDASTAARHVSRLLRGLPLQLKNKNTIEMYEEIARRVKAIDSDEPMYLKVEKVLEQRAPRFYNAKHSLMFLFYH